LCGGCSERGECRSAGGVARVLRNPIRPEDEA
jgi:hypothetical protein